MYQWHRNPNLRRTGRQNFNIKNYSKSFIRRETVAKTAQNPGETFRIGGWGGKLTPWHLIFAILAPAAIYGGAVASGLAKADTGFTSNQDFKKTEQKSPEKSFWKERILPEQKSLEQKLEKAATPAKPLAAEISEDLTSDVEHFQSGQSYGLVSNQAALDIKKVSSGVVGMDWVLDVTLGASPDPAAAYTVKLVAKDGTQLVAAQLDKSVNKIIYPDGTSESGKIVQTYTGFKVPFNAYRIEQSKFSAKGFIVQSKSGSSSDFYQDELSNTASNFNRVVMDYSNDATNDIAGNPPASTIAKRPSFELLSAKRQGNNIVLETAARPNVTCDQDESIMYEAVLGNLGAVLGCGPDGKFNLIVFRDTGAAYGDKIQISGNKVIVPIVDLAALGIDKIFGDSLNGFASLLYTDASQKNTYSAEDAAQSGSLHAKAVSGSSSSPLIMPPQFIFGLDDKLRPTTPFEDTDVANNHDAVVQPAEIFRHDITNPSTAEKYVEWWLYYKDNPACLASVLGKCFITDHHAHDWEVVVDKYDANNKFVGRVTSFHVKVPFYNPGWLFTKIRGDVYVENGGHAISPTAGIFDKPVTSTDSQNKETLFGVKGFNANNKELRNLSAVVEPLSDVKALSDYYASETTDGQFKTKTGSYPPAASLLMGERAKNPWHQSVYSEPWKTFESQFLETAKQPSLLSAEISGPVETTAKIGDKVLGMADGKPKADFYGFYAKDSAKESLTVLLDNYDDCQLEVRGVGSGEYTITLKYLDVSDLNSPAVITKSNKYQIAPGETDVIKIKNSLPQVDRYSATAGGSLAAGLAMGAAAFFLTALGLKKYLKRKQDKLEEK